MSSITFGSVGDIISVSLLVKDLVLALDETRGSAPEYQAISRELLFLDQALLQIEELGRTTRCATPEVQALYGTAKHTVDKCNETIKAFRARIDKFSRCLGDNGSGNCWKDAARKLQWKLSGKEEEVAKFRAELTGYTESLKLLLTTVNLKTMDVNNDKSTYLLDYNLKGTEECIKTCKKGLDEVQERIKDNRREICKGNSIGRRLGDRVQWISSLCCDLKRLLCCVVAGNCAVYEELLALKTVFASRPLPHVIEESFFFEDACGAVMPIPLSLVNSWSVFQAVLESRFRGRPGLSKIRRKEYNLHEEGTQRYVAITEDIRQTILPGTKIVQEIVFHQEHPGPHRDSCKTCPFCQHGVDSPGATSTQCSKCKRYFRQKMGPTSPGFEMLPVGHWESSQAHPKRKRNQDNALDCSPAEGDLLIHFKRICIIIHHKNTGEPESSSTERKPNITNQPDQLASSNFVFAFDHSYTQDNDVYSESSTDSDEDDLFSWGGTDADSDFLSPSVFTPNSLTPKSSSDLLTCNKIWERLQSCPCVQDGDFDLDSLCSDLQQKARCSGSGAVVDANDFRSVMDKYLS